MSIAFISDIHLTPGRPQSTSWFRKFMENAKNRFQQIYILGDLFEYWVGDDGAEILGQTVVEEIIFQTAEAGTEVFFMHGNRDFLVGEDFSKRTHCCILEDPSVIFLGKEKVLLSHGDMLCIDDIEHQKERNIMLQPTWKNNFLNKPLTQRINIAKTLRKESEKNKQTKSLKIMDVNQTKVGKVMLEHGVRTLIHGHTHTPAMHTFSIDNQLYNRYVLGDWYEQESILLYENNNLSLK